MIKNKMKILKKWVYLKTKQEILKGFILKDEIKPFGEITSVIIFDKAKWDHEHLTTFNITDKQIKDFLEKIKDYKMQPPVSFLNYSLFQKVVDKNEEEKIIEDLQNEMKKV